jgi:PLP dependent protein
VHLVHGVDSFKLLKEINKQAEKNKRAINCLLQVHIAQEETKFGFNDEELDKLLTIDYNSVRELKNVKVTGLMGMASFTDDLNKVRNEFQYLKKIFDKYSRLSTSNPIATCLPTGKIGPELIILSMGMSGDYKIAIEEGSTMVRIGSLLFGTRNYTDS